MENDLCKAIIIISSNAGPRTHIWLNSLSLFPPPLPNPNPPQTHFPPYGKLYTSSPGLITWGHYSKTYLNQILEHIEQKHTIIPGRFILKPFEFHHYIKVKMFVVFLLLLLLSNLFPSLAAILLLVGHFRVKSKLFPTTIRGISSLTLFPIVFQKFLTNFPSPCTWQLCSSNLTPYNIVLTQLLRTEVSPSTGAKLCSCAGRWTEWWSHGTLEK